MLYDMRSKYPEAEAQYEKVLAHGPGGSRRGQQPGVPDGRGEPRPRPTRCSSRRPPSAACRTSRNVADTLGWIYYRKGMNSAAVRELERAVEISPKDPLMRYHLGMAYNQSGEINKARIALREALALSTTFPGADEAKKTLAELGG